MWCCTCNKAFPGDCVCESRDERLASLSRSPHLAMRVCNTCEKHADLCRCPDGPTTELRVAKPD